VSGGGTGVVSHAGLALLRHLADKTGLTGGLPAALATPRILVHDRGRVLADLACAIADGARAISDFRVMSDQGELFGLVASVPAGLTCRPHGRDGCLPPGLSFFLVQGTGPAAHRSRPANTDRTRELFMSRLAERSARR
jgi:hypothetical protein